MRLIIVILTLLLCSLVGPARGAETNILIIPSGDHRAGDIYFVDECLTRGVTNSISIGDLRKWATNIVRIYQQREASAEKTNTVRQSSVLAADVPKAIQTMQSRIPACRSDQPMPIEGWDQFVNQWRKSLAISKEEAERRLRTIGPDTDPPTVWLWRSPQGDIEAVSIYWYIYGVIVGPESFEPEWEHAPWYHRKLADGIYLWHGYK
jgi:hypothetical protein